ncbi:hypothetical protein LCGC14_1087620 [marine sediment metagenome]|uniref:Glycosyltransferase 2-like domain-containing protein n=1 Tax=marine sediment metagenome TaxID=412755 RepID=A0A0F9QJD4_9ZZZZ
MRKNLLKDVIERIPNHQLYEIIVIDDGSADNSVERIKEIENREIRIIQHGKNRGYGASILTGFENAIGDIIVTMDSDGQHNPEDIPTLIKPIIKNKADVVVGSRYLGSSTYKIPLHTRLGEYFIQKCLWFLYRQKIRNNQGGFRVFRKETIKLFRNLQNTGMSLTTELLFKAAHNNLKIIETPISLNPREAGTSYLKLFGILISVSFCILTYTVKKFNLHVKHLFPKKTVNYFYSKIKHKKIFQWDYLKIL